MMQTREYQLTEDEARIIDVYRVVDEKGKRHLRGWAEFELEEMEEEARERREKMKVI